ncbi:MAG: aminodeoxychorismate/anthranilate synthase component II [Myxococcales bacterium]|nr:aminodeoxychorismate/anthranilate synthase component II [Myxococcales bacterium]
MILLIDNYDSFTWNLAQALGGLSAPGGGEVIVIRNDAITVAEILARSPSHLVISPGPGTPDEAGVTLSAIAACAGRIPILGVCLGHQAIGQAFGGRVVRAPRVMHGKTSPILHDGRGLFRDLPSPLQAGRYHSLAVEPGSLPQVLEVTARTAEGEVMGIAHRTLAVFGVQFHPESILTPEGVRLLANFLAIGLI